MAISLTQTVKNLFLANTVQTLSVVATPLSGSAITITEANVVQGTFSIDRSSIAGNDIEIGNVSSAELTFAINNADGTFTNFAFEGATLQVTVSVDGNACPLGYFVVDEAKRYNTTINIVALDKMVAFDQEADKTAFGVNASPADVLGVCCTRCGVTLGDISGMRNASLEINISKVTGVCTYRDIIRWVAEATATNAFIDEQGRLCLKWYTNASQTVNDSNRVSHDMQGYAVEITGVEIIDGDTTYMSGEAGYVVTIENNALIGEWDNVAQRLVAIADRLVGFTYQPYTAETLPMAWLMPLDMIDFVKDGTTYRTIVSNVQFALNRNTQIAGRGESPLSKGYAKKALTDAQANGMKALENRTNLAIENAIAPVRNYFWHDSEGSHVSTEPNSTNGKNTLVTSDSFQARTGTTIDASFGATSTIGRTSGNNIQITNSRITFREQTTPLLLMGDDNGSFIRLGHIDTGEHNVVVRDSFVALRNGSDTRIYLGVDSTTDTPFVRVGQNGTDQKNISVTDSGVYLRSGQTAYLTLSADNTSPFVRIGQNGTNQRNVLVRDSAVYIRKATTTLATFGDDITLVNPEPNGTKVVIGTEASSFGNTNGTGVTIETPPMGMNWGLTQPSITIAQGDTTMKGLPFNNPTRDIRLEYTLGGDKYYIKFSPWLGFSKTDTNGVKVAVVRPPNVSNLFLEVTNNASGSITTGNYYGDYNNGGSIKVGSATIDTLAQHSLSVGDSNSITKEDTTALGIGLVTSSVGQTIVGRYNEESEALFAVGNGCSNSKRSNAFSVDADGNVTAQGQMLGGFITIPANANLNTITYTESGRYQCVTSNDAQTLTNSPTETAFEMHVWRLSDRPRNWSENLFLVQDIMDVRGFSWRRQVERQNGTWTYNRWERVQTTPRTDSVSLPSVVYAGRLITSSKVLQFTVPMPYDCSGLTATVTTKPLINIYHPDGYLQMDFSNDTWTVSGSVVGFSVRIETTTAIALSSGKGVSISPSSAIGLTLT